MSERRLRWAVLVFDLEPVVGHEQGGERRALVVSYEPFHRSGMATICPITSQRQEARYPGDVPIPAGEGGQTLAGVILCHQARAVSLLRAKSLIGYLNDGAIRAAVRSRLARHLGLDLPSREDGATGLDVYAPET